MSESFNSFINVIIINIYNDYYFYISSIKFLFK